MSLGAECYDRDGRGRGLIAAVELRRTLRRATIDAPAHGGVVLTAIEKSELLDGVPLFGALDEVARRAIAARAVEVEFPPERPIARQGEVGTGFFLIVRGRVRVVHDGVIIAHLGPGEVFGEISVLDQMPRIAASSPRSRRSASPSRAGTSSGCSTSSRGSRSGSCGRSPGGSASHRDAASLT